ncbi:hypothetical protein F0L74_03020 [Chitinophaga agrisoli]|uniref:Uncharacterized protein n=1 Tax=Chitinophaga agrisoli TaxID=2607653 RepID=A0A5B2W260_9BACT|nr:hypothetical protein [Chitinophaga agrisoli]KAA2244948.1 hypothetical protein F0L74_03020 [Chitinophaga agrisoli]
MRISLLLGCLLLCYCSTVKKTAAPANDLYTSAQEWTVTTNDGWFSAKTIRYGAYTTADRKNGITPAVNIAFKNVSNAFNFVVKDKAEQILVQTLNTPLISFSGRKLPDWLEKQAPNTPLFYSLINGIQSQPLVRWELVLKSPHYLELNANKPAGVLRSPAEDIRITAHNRFGVMNSYEKLCYEFQYRGVPVAAVMPGEQPRVWVSKTVTADKEKILAAAIGALLLR